MCLDGDGAASVICLTFHWLGLVCASRMVCLGGSVAAYGVCFMNTLDICDAASKASFPIV